jgi:hypothetical protein
MKLIDYQSIPKPKGLMVALQGNKEDSLSLAHVLEEGVTWSGLDSPVREKKCIGQ